MPGAGARNLSSGSVALVVGMRTTVLLPAGSFKFLPLFLAVYCIDEIDFFFFSPRSRQCTKLFTRFLSVATVSPGCYCFFRNL